MESISVEWTEWVVHKLFFWESDNRKKGRALRSFHHFVMHALLVMIVVSHTLYPAFWLQTLVLGMCYLIWVQHVLANGCVVSKVEQKLIGDTESFVDPILELFNVKPTKEISIAVVVLGSTLSVFLLSLEWVARVFHKAYPILRSMWTEMQA
jgi:hypothetical protein